MLSYLEPIKGTEYDCLYFMPDQDDDSVNVEAALYKEQGELIGGSSIGHLYHIMLFKDGESGFTHYDAFESILACPLEYISHLIPCGWFGAICKKTTHSQEFFDEIQENIKKGLTEE